MDHPTAHRDSESGAGRRRLSQIIRPKTDQGITPQRKAPISAIKPRRTQTTESARTVTVEPYSTRIE